MGITWHGAAARGRARQTARANARFDRIVASSAAGLTKEQAAADAGLTVGGLKSLLGRKGLGMAWPIAPEKLK